jgi:hypothetical protein
MIILRGPGAWNPASPTEDEVMSGEYRQLTDFLLGMGIDKVPHTQKTYLGHLIAVYRLMESRGCDEELCRAGMFHSIYGTEKFQGFKLPLERRGEVRALIGERAERLAYLNCAMDRASFDRAVLQQTGPYRLVDRLTGQEVILTEDELADLCRVHLYDWLEQVPRSREWDYRRAAYRGMARRLGEGALEAYHAVFAAETAVTGVS